ncbi:MAG: TolC family protein [Geothrix sp.]|uniref:TolC family protein n=1 Tax=Geothrix sp. TaxID=1962974 RepID=UPI0017D8F513|nr:TolC family protein [Geothrix sp.]NWJ39433.1 TolC family protein [Geothrix sp.]WIL19342.1 MAG: TolC family protein [Geothrix sp.]
MTRLPILPALLVAFSLVAQEAPKVQPPAGAPTKLTLQGAIETSLKNNLQVQIAVETRDFTRAGVQIEQGAFDWNLTSGLSISKTQDGIRYQNPDGTFGKLEGTNFFRSLTVGSTKAFGWGGNLSLSYAPTYSSHAGTLYTGNTTNPYDGSFAATYTQSLLRNFGRDTTESRLIVARKSALAADLGFQKAIIDLVASTESLYWDVVFGQRNLENKQQALDLAQKQLKENQIRVQVGTLAPIEVTSSEASVAQREQDIIAAEAQLLNAKDALIRALYPSSERPAGLEMADTPSVKALEMNEAAAEKQALANRIELKSARLDLESKQILETAAANRTLPQLDAFATYNGSAASQVPSEGLAAVNKDLTKGTYPGYTVGLQFALPLQNRAARGNQAQARANRRQSELGLRDLELGITLETRQAFRNVDASAKGVAAAEKTRYFREKDLEAEQKKFENGMSTNFLVLSKQNDLDTAKSNELQSQITYAKAITALEKALGHLLEARKLEVK